MWGPSSPSGLSGKQNELFPLGSDIKCILFLDQSEARRAEKNFFGDSSPPFSKGLDDRPPLSQGLDPALQTLYFYISVSGQLQLRTTLSRP